MSRTVFQNRGDDNADVDVPMVWQLAAPTPIACPDEDSDEAVYEVGDDDSDWYESHAPNPDIFGVTALDDALWAQEDAVLTPTWFHRCPHCARPVRRCSCPVVLEAA